MVIIFPPHDPDCPDMTFVIAAWTSSSCSNVVLIAIIASMTGADIHPVFVDVGFSVSALRACQWVGLI